MKNQYREFGNLLRRRREEQGFTQEGLRDTLNSQGYKILSKGTISKWENGNSRPRIEVVEDLEDKLIMSRGTLLRPAGYPVEGSVTVSNDATQLGIVIAKRLEEHFDRLANMVNSLLANGLETITQNDSVVFPYFLWSGQSGIAIPRELLSSYLQQNMNQLYLDYKDFDLRNFMCHFEAECPEIQSKGLPGIIKDNPYELIQILIVLSQRKIFKGTCPICKEWQIIYPE